MKKIIIFLGLLSCIFTFSQTINFKGCTPLFENQTYIFNNTTTDSFGKKVYITTPTTGDQDCGGLGTCEFKLQWNNTIGRWEFLADSGNGDFVNPYLIYYSTTQNTSASNPPNAEIGTWVENNAVTMGDCGGNLTAANSTFTGDVRTVTLGNTELEKETITIFPNPATDFITINGITKVNVLRIYNMDGKIISTLRDTNSVNISGLASGVYFLEINTDKTTQKRIKFIKK